MPGMPGYLQGGSRGRRELLGRLHQRRLLGWRWYSSKATRVAAAANASSLPSSARAAAVRLALAVPAARRQAGLLLGLLLEAARWRRLLSIVSVTTLSLALVVGGGRTAACSPSLA